jgi:outer membrane protein assembly factor BamB
MIWTKRFLSLGLCGAMAAVASAQHANSVWPQFRANNGKQGAVQAPGPAINHAWTLGTTTALGTVSSGGFSVDSDGDIYYQSNDDPDGSGNGPAYVFRIDANAGTLLARSPNLNGNVGNYGGVAVGVDELYCVTNDPADSRVVVLNKDTCAILREYSSPQFISLRGTPIISDMLNTNGNHNLYVTDRGLQAIHAVDAATGQIMWTYDTPTSHVLGFTGPMWVTQAGKQALAFFGNNALGPGAAIEDNGDNTFNVLWQDAGPGNFNWWGSGVLSADGTRIYVTTFNDGDTASLWAIDITDGSVIWSVPGLRGQPLERNYFPRPAVVGNRIYAAGGFNVVSCFEDMGATYRLVWEHRTTPEENTAVSAAKDPDTGITYVYSARQGLPENIGLYRVIRDEGESFTVLLETTLNDTMKPSIFGGNGLTIDGDGSVYVGSGLRDGARAQIYKFEVGGCGFDPCDTNCDNAVDAFDIEPFINILLGNPGCSPCAADVDGNGVVDAFDIEPFINCLVGP